MFIPILFENNHFLVLSKPSGLVVHPFDHSTEETLLDFLYAHAPLVFSITNEKKLMDGRIINLGGLVHKLDRDTSGVLVVAKEQETFENLQSQFKEHHITKIYTALVEGAVKEESFRIDAPLGRNKKEYKQSVNPTNPRNTHEVRDAITDVHVLARNGGMTFVELSPLTGRTHQLRAHMSHIGHPIVGDKAYGSTTPAARIMLHAKKLTFTLYGNDYSFLAESPFTVETMK